VLSGRLRRLGRQLGGDLGRDLGVVADDMAADENAPPANDRPARDKLLGGNGRVGANRSAGPDPGTGSN
jgi:hypothetical protein